MYAYVSDGIKHIWFDSQLVEEGCMQLTSATWLLSWSSPVTQTASRSLYCSARRWTSRLLSSLPVERSCSQFATSSLSSSATKTGAFPPFVTTSSCWPANWSTMVGEAFENFMIFPQILTVIIKLKILNYFCHIVKQVTSGILKLHCSIFV